MPPNSSTMSNSNTSTVETFGSSVLETANTASTTTTAPTTTKTLASNVSNTTFDEIPQIPVYIRTTAMFFCIIIMVLGVIGNIMVPIVIVKTKDMRNSTNIFLTNLSIADLLVLLVCTPTVLVEVNTRPETWVLGHEMCKAVPFVELTVAHASVLTILAISFERYYAICEPLKAGYVCTKTRAIFICFLAWAIAALFTSPIILIATYREEIYYDGTEAAVCFTSADTFWSAFYFISSITIFFMLPFAVLVLLYVAIACKLLRRNSAFHRPTAASSNITASMNERQSRAEVKMQSSQHQQSNGMRKHRKQVIFMLIAVVSSFFVCLLPFRAFTLWVIASSAEEIAAIGIEGYYNILFFCRIMFYLNSALNPILYNLMSSKFRTGFRRLLLSCCGVAAEQRTRNIAYTASHREAPNTLLYGDKFTQHSMRRDTAFFVNSISTSSQGTDRTSLRSGSVSTAPYNSFPNERNIGAAIIGMTAASITSANLHDRQWSLHCAQ
ncbi:growth hormone secretagogue receptor type 1-like isoform X2 [Teleopsis dalmanni]|uniref:growth hormone secretagogue receptor type 1-like isoform X2 n=1 Tax=Teleopsis dalmanni TaxID=139649 RepID=UPI0018CFA2C5|nr:growth hormone secretagogue receptor type 1-like isoform X2 [Teleopsis dalmanni]